MKLKTVFEKVLDGRQPTGEERAYLLDWLTRAENLPGGTNPITGQTTVIQTGPTQNEIDAMVQQAMTSGRVPTPRVSDLTRELGLMRSGEFRTGNGVTPGDGFTGGRFGWPGFTYGADTYFLVGVENDVLQVGLSLADGKIYAGGGAVVIDEDGITTTGATIQSANYVQGASGFRIQGDTGDAEFNNIIARGLIKTAVFEHDTISAVGGSLFVLGSYELIQDMGPEDLSHLHLSSDQLDVGDIVRMKDGADDEWMEVADVDGATGNWEYTMLRDKAGVYASGANPAWKKGQAVVNYGASGEGGVELTAGANPYIRVFDHSGSPWTTIREVVRLDGGGVYVANNQIGVFGFKTTAGATDEIYLSSSATDDLDLINQVGGKKIAMRTDTAAHAVLDLEFGEDSIETGAALLSINPPSGIGIFQLSSGVEIWSGKDSTVTVFNEDSFDIDFRIEGATDTSLFMLDAGLDAIGIGGAAESGYKLKVTGSQRITDGLTWDGWAAGTGTWSYSSADDPTFVMSMPDADAEKMNIGDRIKLTQTSAKYFIVTAKGTPSGGSTPVTIYGGTDYDLANATITSPYYSHVKNPLGFPASPAKWTVEYRSTTNGSQASPVANTWYNAGSHSISIPIGAWRVYYQNAVFVTNGATPAAVNVYCTLSTANNSESDIDFSVSVSGSDVKYIYGPIMREKLLGITSKTTYYLNIRTVSPCTAIGDDAARSPVLIRAVCAYL